MEEKLSRRELKKLQSRNAIIEAAIEQFRIRGYQDTAVADIMRAAQLGLGTFYNYFSSKEDILQTLLDNITGQLTLHLDELRNRGLSMGEVLSEMVVFTAQIIDSNRFVLPLFLSTANASGSGEPESRVHAPAFMKMFLELVREGQAKGDFRDDISPELITETFHSLFQAAAFSHLPVSFEENIRQKLKLLLGGLLRR